MALAHFSHTPLHILEEWPVSKIVYWHGAAIKVSNKMNSGEQ